MRGIFHSKFRVAMSVLFRLVSLMPKVTTFLYEGGGDLFFRVCGVASAAVLSVPASEDQPHELYINGPIKALRTTLQMSMRNRSLQSHPVAVLRPLSAARPFLLRSL